LAPHFLKKLAESNQSHEPQRGNLGASKTENVFQLLERALQTLEFLHQRCAELNKELDSAKKRSKEFEEKCREWERIAQASLEQEKHSEQLRMSVQTQLDKLTKEVEKKASAEGDDISFHERIWSMFCAHSKSYEILKEVANGSYNNVTGLKG
jgi:predicted RNase H-like nuclease (RuvC/YqgF family)